MEEIYTQLEDIFGDLSYEKIDSIITNNDRDVIEQCLIKYKNILFTLKNTDARGQAPGYFISMLKNSKSNLNHGNSSNEGINYEKALKWNKNSYQILKSKQDGMIEAYIKAYEEKDFHKDILDYAERHYHQTGWYIHCNERIIEKVEKKLSLMEISDYKQYKEYRKKLLEAINPEKEYEKCRKESILVLLHQWAYDNSMIKYYAKNYNPKIKREQ